MMATPMPYHHHHHHHHQYHQHLHAERIAHPYHDPFDTRISSEGILKPIHTNGQQSSKADTSRRRPDDWASGRPSCNVALIPAVTAVPRFLGPDAPEHMLRRKTPNGTLSAGYNGTPVEPSVGPRPRKHLLVRSPDVALPDDWHSLYGTRSWGRPRHSERIFSTENNAASQGQSHPCYKLQTDVPINHAPRLQTAPYNNAHGPPIDSMLHQIPSSQHGYSRNGPPFVPVALQPTWPPNIGPTASNPQTPYGPYWPNGAFEPYRPAALRDGRFQAQFARINIDDSIESQTPFKTSRLSDHPTQNMDSEAAIIFEPAKHSEPGSIRSSRTSFLHRSEQNAAFRTDGYNEIYGPTDQSFGGHLLAQHSAPFQYGNPSFNASEWSSATHIQVLTPQIGPRQSERLKYREHFLVEAHKIYMKLLAAKQQERRRKPSKPQPSDIALPTAHIGSRLPRHLQSYSRAEAVGHDLDRRRAGAAVLTDGATRSFVNRTSPMFDPDNGMHPQFTHKPSPSFSQDAPDVILSTANRSFFERRQSSYARPSSFLPCDAVLQQHPSPVLEAKTTLQILSGMAQESDWKWTDGMLLGGCLAYGMGDAGEAVKWYSRVLACEPNNVEAMSNMAATFVAMNKLTEAEHLWQRAIKLRPAYFEAIEHLVGLYCNTHRGRDAIQIIDWIQDALKLPEEAQLDSSSPFARNVFGIPQSVNYDAHTHFKSLSLYGAGYGLSGYQIPGTDNGRLIALLHAKGNMLYASGDTAGAAKAFEDAIMVAAGRRCDGTAGLIREILQVFARQLLAQCAEGSRTLSPCETILLKPAMALKTAELVFPDQGQLPGLKDVPDGQPKRAGISITSNSLLSLAKIYQDGMSSAGAGATSSKAAAGVQDILALYYLSLSLQPSPSTANNVGILLASVQQAVTLTGPADSRDAETPTIPGVIPGSGIAMALAYYNYGLNLDNRHAHLYTNLGSLLKDIGQLHAAIKMYEQAVACDGSFDIALANLANAVKDQGRISDAIGYYKRAVAANPEFAEAVCGLANALNSVCGWTGRGGVRYANGRFDRWHVDEQGMLSDARESQVPNSGWIGQVVTIVEKQLREGRVWGRGVLQRTGIRNLLSYCSLSPEDARRCAEAVYRWMGENWEGANIVRYVERATKRICWERYQHKYVQGTSDAFRRYERPQLPAALTIPNAPTVLPFHTFTCPLTASQVRKISQRNALRLSCSTLKAPWLPCTIFKPPAPPNPCLNVGYVSSDFNNHPLAHLMQSVFGFHDRSKVKAFCYATTVGDGSAHREQIRKEAPVFYDAASWPLDKLVQQIVDDDIHILINLNGYTRGARNEVFAARPAPIQMTFMGFAGTLGAEWCDYIVADSTAIPPSTLRPYRSNVDLLDLVQDGSYSDEHQDWVYGENIIFARDTFFCCDHRQSAPDAQEPRLAWAEELQRRRRMRKELFPDLPDDAIILGNFNQLYKIEPTTFRTWLRILQALPTAVLWLLRFPDLGEANLRATALQWSSSDVASRIIFTDVAPKHQHISRARICDLFLDTPECNAHTTAADVLWSGTPLLTLPRYDFKMCSRIAASILKGALPRGEEGERCAAELIASSDEEYEERAVRLGRGLASVLSGSEKSCRLLELRRILYEGRWTSALFDTRRWVRDLEEAYGIAWDRWVKGEGGDIWL